MTDAQSATVTSLLKGGLTVVPIPDSPKSVKLYCQDQRAPYALMRYVLWPVTESLLLSIAEHGAQRGFRFYVTDRILGEREVLRG